MALSLAAAWLNLRRPGWGAPEVLPNILPSVPAQVLSYTLGKDVKAGPTRLIVLRLTGPVALQPMTFAQVGLKEPAPIDQFADRLQAPVVFNAGQFDANRRYLGWLKGQGMWLSQARKMGWQGLLVTAPSANAAPQKLPFAAIIDLETLGVKEAQSLADAYSNVVQSMMLLDEAAHVRVRNSGKVACRTVVAEDRQGRMLIIASEGAISLYDLAQWLTRSDLQILRAMNLDGGMESQLAIRTDALNLTLYASYATESPLVGARTGGAHAPLPMVVAAMPHSGRGL